MNYLAHLKLALDAIEQGMLFEATEHLSHAADEVDKLPDKYQRGKDAVAALHSKLERMIGALEIVQMRLSNEVIPKWGQVADAERVSVAPELPRLRPPKPSFPPARIIKEGSDTPLDLSDPLDGLTSLGLLNTADTPTQNEEQDPPLFVEDVLPDEELAEVLGVEDDGQ